MTDEPDFGPAMLALDERKRKFVLHWIANGGKDAASAARAAGYSDKSEAAKVQAHRLLRSARISAALKEEAERNLGLLPVLAVLRMKDLLRSKNVKASQAAIDSVLDRTGFGRKTTQDIHVHKEDTRSTAELLEVLRQFQLSQSNIVDVTPKQIEHAKEALEA